MVAAGQGAVRQGRASALLVAALRGRHVEGGVAVEETVGPELESDPGDRHYRPVLRGYHVVSGKRVPGHQVGVLQRAVGRGPGRRAVPAGVLVGVVPRGEPLIWVVRGAPRVLGAELAPPQGGVIG